MSVKLIPVVFKRSKVHYQHKYAGGTLHVGKKYYTRRVMGNANPLALLMDIVEGKKENTHEMG